ncbi:MAG: hypothetical protein J5927_03850 [Oscillospiraceae bacterium]|nr:hypothetical protein [Oscillospiraceae bacterium]
MRFLALLLIVALGFGLGCGEARAASPAGVIIEDLVPDDTEELPVPGDSEGQNKETTPSGTDGPTEPVFLVEDDPQDPTPLPTPQEELKGEPAAEPTEAPKEEPKEEPKMDGEEDAQESPAPSSEKQPEDATSEELPNGDEAAKKAEDTETPSWPETTKAVRYNAEQEATAYDTLSGALAAAENGDRIVLIRSVGVSGPVVIRRNVTLDLGGRTLRVNAPAETAECAIRITDGARVRLENGSLAVDSGVNEAEEPVGYRNGILADASASVVLDRICLDYSFSGGSMLSAEEGAAQIQITGGGEYSEDPRAFLGEDLDAEDAPEGFFRITKKLQVLAAEAGDPLTPDAAGAARIGDHSYETLAEAMQVELGEDEEIVLLKNGEPITAAMVAVDTVINLNGHTLGSVAVPEGKTLALYNGQTGDISSWGGLVLSGVTTGGITASAGSSGNGVLAIDTEKGSVTVSSLRIVSSASATPKLLVSIPGGSFGSLTLEGSGANLSSSDLGTGLPVGISGGSFASPVPAILAASGYSPTIRRSDGTYSVGRTPSLTAADGSTYAQYYKDKDDKAKNKDLVLVSDIGIKSARVTTGELPGVTASGTQMTISVSDARNAACFQALPAGRNTVMLTFANDVSGRFPVFVWPDVELVSTRYVKESGKNIVIKLSDPPDGVSLGKTQNAADHRQLLTVGTDVTIGAGEAALVAASLDRRDEGTWYVGLHYGGGSILYAITIVPAPTITPTQSEWGAGSGSKSFAVTPVQVDGKKAVTGVSLGGTALTSSQYSVDDKGVVTVKEAAITDLKLTVGASYPLTVTTLDGPVTAMLTIVPTLKVKGSNSHTSGGSKDLVFQASNPIKELWIGSTQLKSNQYVLSADKMTVTLKASYLNSLALGTYKLTAVVDIGQLRFLPDAAFKVISASAAASSPRTADPNDPMLWASLMMVSGAALVALIPKKRKHE